VHDISDGGLLVTVAEMAMAGGTGAALETRLTGKDLAAWCFGEDQGCYVVTTSDPAALLAAAKKAGVPAARIGITGGPELTVAGAGAISVEALRRAHEDWFPSYMDQATAGNA
jgi:phosphoribosylformylglycinamidine synthase